MSIELLLSLIGAVAAILGGYWALTKMAIAAFNRGLDERFAAQDKARADAQRLWDERFATQDKAREEGHQQYLERQKRNESKLEELERDVRKILIELPREYVNRSDYVRRETIIEAKIDQLSLRIQNWILEGKRNA